MSPTNGIQVKNLDPQAPSDCPECGLIVTRVKDTGIGMSKDVVEKLFKMFSLDNNPQSKRGIITTQGVGLGLSISKQLVENLGGKIKIETFPGMGTEVAFSVPFKCAECAEITKYHQNGGGAPLNQSNLNNALITPNANALMKSSVFVQAAYPQIVGGYQPNPPPATILSDGQGLAQGESQSPIPNIPLHQRGETINSSKDNSTNQQLALLTPSSVPSTPFAQQQQIAKNVLKQQPFGGRIQSLFNNDKKRSNQFKAASGAVNSSIKMPYKNEENTIQQNEYIGKGDGPSGVGVGVLALHAQGSSTSKNKSMFHSMQPLANFQSASGQQGIHNGPGGNWQQNNSVESSKQNFEIGGIQSFFNKPPANDARRQSQKYKVNLVFNQNSSTPQLGEKKDGFAKSFQVNKYVVQSGIHIGERPGNTFLPSHIKPSNNFTGDQFNGQHEFLFDPVNHPNKKEIVANTDQQLHILGQLHLCKQENSQNQYQASIYESHCETGNEIEEEKYDLEGGRGQKRLRVNNNRRINQQHYQDYFASVNSLHPEGENTQKYFGRTIWHANNLKQIGRVRFDWDEKLQQKEISDRSVFLDQHQTARDQSNDGISLSDNQWITPQYYNQQQIGAEGGAIQQSNQLDIERSLQPGHEFENSQDDVIPLAPSRTLSLQKHQKVISGGKMHVVRRQDYDEGTDIHKSSLAVIEAARQKLWCSAQPPSQVRLRPLLNPRDEQAR
ncbi:hypothetical protein FGO68_gene13162 [Halteria grandinella]|uniref:Histidine kinase domain-containing protein n=1 Tax=Halteria grandinella TaxID=5974 RepID=A0A8J8NHS2_HALGN|nr:hypothetical protein FGO68_gene13162 [Halteria grandinella]